MSAACTHTDTRVCMCLHFCLLSLLPIGKVWGKMCRVVLVVPYGFTLKPPVQISPPD